MDWLKVIAVIQVVGGIHGLIQLIAGAFASPAMQDAGIISHILFACLSGISIIAGILLWFKKRRGFVWSIVLQFLQGVRITFGPFNYGFNLFLSLGVYVRFLKNSSGIGVDFEFFDTYFYLYTKIIYKFNLYLPFDVVVNVSSLFCFFYLYFMFDKLYPMESPYNLQEAS
ncbi:hypothetical protein NKDENANG_02852 [Candidatus Entotheonellaceae bacterium PAL068K]